MLMDVDDKDCIQGLAKAYGNFLHSGNQGGSYLLFEEASNCIGEPLVAVDMPAPTNLQIGSHKIDHVMSSAKDNNLVSLPRISTQQSPARQNKTHLLSNWKMRARGSLHLVLR